MHHTRMRKLLVFQHSAREPLGLLDPLLRRRGFRIRYVNFSRHPGLQPDVSRYNGLIVLGGPMNVDQADRFPHLAAEIAVIQEALKRDIPILGICLGAQLLAAALGANVRPHTVREIGWYRLHPGGRAERPRDRGVSGTDRVAEEGAARKPLALIHPGYSNTMCSPRYHWRGGL